MPSTIDWIGQTRPVQIRLQDTTVLDWAKHGSAICWKSLASPRRCCGWQFTNCETSLCFWQTRRRGVKMTYQHINLCQARCNHIKAKNSEVSRFSSFINCTRILANFSFLPTLARAFCWGTAFALYSYFLWSKLHGTEVGSNLSS